MQNRLLLVVVAVVSGTMIVARMDERSESSDGASTADEVRDAALVKNDASAARDRTLHDDEAPQELRRDEPQTSPVDTPPVSTVTVESASAAQNSSPDDELWARDMEQRVFVTLARTETIFTSIDHVTCARPTCEVQYTTGRAPSPGIMGELLVLFGRDDRGALILGSASLSRREIYPGTNVPILTLSFDGP
jgi:hypothetical protein